MKKSKMIYGRDIADDKRSTTFGTFPEIAITPAFPRDVFPGNEKVEVLDIENTGS